MADTIATREFIERTLDERVGIINTRLQDISGSPAENTADLLSAISSDVNETFSRMAQEGVTVESRTTADLKTALVRTINKVAEESAGSGSGGGTITPPVEEEQESVNLLRAPFTLTEDMVSEEGYGESMETLDYAFNFEVGKYYIAKGTCGENNIPFEIPSMAINMEGMVMFYGISAEEDLAIIIYDKFTFDEEFNPVPSDTGSVAMISGSTSKYPTPIIVDSISLMNRNSNCLNDIHIPNDSVTTTYTHYQEDDIDVYCPIVSANIPMDSSVLDGTIKSLTVKMGDRTLVCDGMMLGEIETGVGGYTDDGLEFNAFFESEMGGGALTLIKGYRSNYYIMNEETGDFDYELIKDDTCMCIVGYLMFMDAITQEEVKDIIYYRPPVTEALNTATTESREFWLSRGYNANGSDFNKYFKIKEGDHIGDYAFSGFRGFSYNIHIPAGVSVDSNAFVGTHADTISFDENAQVNLNLENASFNELQLPTTYDFSGSYCFRNASYNGQRLNLGGLGSYYSDTFDNARILSINSDNTGEWIFTNEENTGLWIYGNAFNQTGVQGTLLEFNYPNVTSFGLHNTVIHKFDKIVFNCPHAYNFYGEDGYGITSNSLKELIFNIHTDGSRGYFISESLTKIWAPTLEKFVCPCVEVSDFGGLFEGSSLGTSQLKYLDVYYLNPENAPKKKFTKLETLVLRMINNPFDIDHLLTDYLDESCPIMQGIGVVYVPDDDIDSFRAVEAYSKVVFKTLTEFELGEPTYSFTNDPAEWNTSQPTAYYANAISTQCEAGELYTLTYQIDDEVIKTKLITAKSSGLFKDVNANEYTNYIMLKGEDIDSPDCVYIDIIDNDADNLFDVYVCVYGNANNSYYQNRVFPKVRIWSIEKAPQPIITITNDDVDYSLETPMALVNLGTDVFDEEHMRVGGNILRYTVGDSCEMLSEEGWTGTGMDDLGNPVHYQYFNAYIYHDPNPPYGNFDLTLIKRASDGVFFAELRFSFSGEYSKDKPIPPVTLYSLEPCNVKIKA